MNQEALSIDKSLALLHLYQLIACIRRVDPHVPDACSNDDRCRWCEARIREHLGWDWAKNSAKGYRAHPHAADCLYVLAGIVDAPPA